MCADGTCPECPELVNQLGLPKAPLYPLLLMEVPVERIGMDLIRPFHRSTHRFVLVLLDYALPYPKAVSTPTISAESVGRALFRVISPFSIPKQILTDQGTLFMSCTLKELHESWILNSSSATPPTPLLFTVQEVPQASTGFPPFRLLFGRKPRKHGADCLLNCLHK